MIKELMGYNPYKKKIKTIKPNVIDLTTPSENKKNNEKVNNNINNINNIPYIELNLSPSKNNEEIKYPLKSSQNKPNKEIPKKTKVITVSNYTNKAIKAYLKKNKLYKNKKNTDISKQPIYKEYYYMEDINNKEKHMEDFHCIKDNLIKEEYVSVFAIFDGHGGNQAAIYCKDNLIRIISKAIISSCYNIPKCLEFTYNKLNEEFNNKTKQNDVGCTMSCVVLIRDKEDANKKYIYISNVGDSKIYILKKDGNSIQMSKDHTCKDTVETERIKQKGGLVFNQRVFGSLMLTRTIGDKEMKKYGVICQPYINEYIIQNDDNYIIIASDGLWDVITEEDLSMYAKEEDMGAEAVSKRLVLQALEKGTTDNISCIVIKI